MDEKIVVCWYHRMPHSNKKEQITDTHKNMDESISQTLLWIKEALHKESLKVKYAI